MPPPASRTTAPPDPDAGWVVAANASAGSVDDADLGRAVLRLAASGPVEVCWMEEPDDVVAVAREHADRRLVLHGGDGTISSSVDRLIRADLGDRPVGLLPGGTGNDFVRAVGLPTDPVDAAEVLPGAQPRRLSALRLGDRHGVNACHVGLGAAASRAADGMKDRLGPAAYPVGALLTGVRTEGWRATISADGDEGTPLDLLFAAVVLGRTIGGGTDLAPEASIDDDRASLLVSEGRGIRARGRLGAALLRRDPGEGTGARRTSAARVRIHGDEPFPVNLDGEDLGDRTDLTVEVVEEAWTILAPS